MIPKSMKWTRWRPNTKLLCSHPRFHGERYQDKFVFERYFRDKINGFYVDAGALDGVHINNTLFFEKLGWEGVCIEGSSSNYFSLIKNRKCYCVNSVIGDGSVVTFHISSCSGRNSVIKEVAVSNGDRIIGTNYNVRSDRLDYLLDQCKAPSVIDFLCMDIEGMEERAFSCFQFDRYRFNVMLIEVMHIDKVRFGSFLLSHGYKKDYDLGADWVFVHENFT